MSSIYFLARGGRSPEVIFLFFYFFLGLLNFVRRGEWGFHGSGTWAAGIDRFMGFA